MCSILCFYQTEELLHALTELEQAASSDAAVCKRIATLPLEVQDTTQLSRVTGKKPDVEGFGKNHLYYSSSVSNRQLSKSGPEKLSPRCRKMVRSECRRNTNICTKINLVLRKQSWLILAAKLVGQTLSACITMCQVFIFI